MKQAALDLAPMRARLNAVRWIAAFLDALNEQREVWLVHVRTDARKFGAPEASARIGRLP